VTATTVSAPPATTPDSRRWKALAVVLVGQLVILVDATIVNVAVPSIELACTPATRRWSG